MQAVNARPIYKGIFCFVQMMKLDVIEHELGLCIAELGMLQSECEAGGAKPSYVQILEKLTLLLEQLVRVCALGPFIEPIRVVINKAYLKVNNLDINNADHWKRVLSAIKHVNSVVDAIGMGAVLIPDPESRNLKLVCDALVAGTIIDNEAVFLSIDTVSKRNTRMILLLKDIGDKLDTIRDGGTGAARNFYSFLGIDGHITMVKIIELLKNAS